MGLNISKTMCPAVKHGPSTDVDLVGGVGGVVVVCGGDWGHGCMCGVKAGCMGSELSRMFTMSEREESLKV